MFIQRILLLTVALFMLSGCAVQYEGVKHPNDGRQLHKLEQKTQQSIKDLSIALKRMSPKINPAEANDVAYDAHVYPMHLANEWNLTWPPLWHNVLRNNKHRQLGLCTDWTQAMRARMYKKNLKTFDLWWGVAFLGNSWREHSTLVVTAKGAPFNSGIILDPWRNSGELFWSRVPDDYKYPWKVFQGPEKAARNHVPKVKRIK